MQAKLVWKEYKMVRKKLFYWKQKKKKPISKRTLVFIIFLFIKITKLIDIKNKSSKVIDSEVFN